MTEAVPELDADELFAKLVIAIRRIAELEEQVARLGDRVIASPDELETMLKRYRSWAVDHTVEHEYLFCPHGEHTGAPCEKCAAEERDT